MSDEREVLSWDDFGAASRDLARQVLDGGYRPDIVVAVARGGLLLAGSIAYALGTKSCGSINVEMRTSSRVSHSGSGVSNGLSSHG